MKKHHYTIQLNWEGNTGKGTENYRSYLRDFTVNAPDKKVVIPGSSDPAFRGDPSRYNPEEMLVASLSSCHMLWYLHLCATNGITVVDYTDAASGVMLEKKDGSGAFESVTLKPKVIIKEAEKVPEAEMLHQEANRLCFIAQSCNFAVLHEAEINVAET